MPEVIDGEDWIKKRLTFLRARLTEVLTDDERIVIEDEIGALSNEAGAMPGGRRFPRMWRLRGRNR